MGIKLAFEIPVKNLKYFSKFADYDFVLTHLLFKNNEYVDFYKEQVKNGRLVMLDNSAFELGESIGIDKIIEGIKILEYPKMTFGPDYLGNMQKTIDGTKLFIEKIKEENLFDKTTIVGIVQGETFEDWLKCYDTFIKMKEIKAIGITFDNAFKIPGYLEDAYSITKNWMNKRIFLINYLYNNKLIKKPIHLLGASDGYELYYQNKYNFIETCDTSSPIVHGWKGIRYTSTGLPCEKIKEKLKFDDEIPSEKWNDVLYNISILKSFANSHFDEY